MPHFYTAIKKQTLTFKCIRNMKKIAMVVAMIFAATCLFSQSATGASNAGKTSVTHTAPVKKISGNAEKSDKKATEKSAAGTEGQKMASAKPKAKHKLRRRKAKTTGKTGTAQNAAAGKKKTENK